MRIGLFIPAISAPSSRKSGSRRSGLLKRFGCELIYPRDQTSCGQPWLLPFVGVAPHEST